MHYIKIINSIQNNNPVIIDSRFINNIQLNEINEYIKKHNNFSYLSIKDNTYFNINDYTYKHLFNSLINCKSLQTFKFKCLYHNYLYFNELISMLKNNTSIKNLYITYYYITPYELIQLLDAIKNNTLIKISLHFFYKNLNSKRIIQWSPYLFNPEYLIINSLLNQINLQKICIKGSFLGSEIVYKKMCLLLDSLDNLKSFKVYNYDNGYIFDNYKYNKMFYSNILKKQSLKNLTLNINNQKTLMNIISSYKNLLHLNIKNIDQLVLNNNLIYSIIISNLTKLNITYMLKNKNQILTLLKYNNTITKIKLNNIIQNEELYDDTFFNVLQLNKSLKKLIIYPGYNSKVNNFSDKVINNFCKYLSNNNTLETLKLYSNFISDPNCIKILTSLNNNTTLKKIYFLSNIYLTSKYRNRFVNGICNFIKNSLVDRKIYFRDILGYDNNVNKRLIKYQLSLNMVQRLQIFNLMSIYNKVSIEF